MYTIIVFKGFITNVNLRVATLQQSKKCLKCSIATGFHQDWPIFDTLPVFLVGQLIYSHQYGKILNCNKLPITKWSSKISHMFSWFYLKCVASVLCILFLGSFSSIIINPIKHLSCSCSCSGSIFILCMYIHVYIYILYIYILYIYIIYIIYIYIIYIYIFIHTCMEVSRNRGTPKSSKLRSFLYWNPWWLGDPHI